MSLLLLPPLTRLLSVHYIFTILFRVFLRLFGCYSHVVFFHLGDSPASEFYVPSFRNTLLHLMFIGPCIIVIVEEWKTNLISLAILFHFLCAQHVSDINVSIIRSLRLCWWITTSVVLFSVRCVLEQNEHHLKPAAPKGPTHNELRRRRPIW